MSNCKMCGADVPQKGTNPRLYCDACKKVRAAEYDKRKRAEAKEKAASNIDKIAKSADNALKKKRTSLTLLLKSLDVENAKRRELGLVPLSYGKYVAMIESGKIN